METTEINLPLLDKIKAIGVAAGVAAVAAIAQVVAGVDWTSFGVFGPALGLAIGAGVGYVRRERLIANLLGAEQDSR